MPERINRLTFIVLTALLLVSSGSPAYAQKESAAELEYKVKAGFIFNFLKFVSWPNDKPLESESWDIGIIAGDGILELMTEALEGKTVDGRAIRIHEVDPQEAFHPCHVVFVCQTSTERAAVYTDSLREQAVLIVGESEDFARTYGIIGFVKKRQNLRLEINPARAKAADLVISGKLASLAELVEEK